MTLETRMTIELKDIKAIELECSVCHAKMVYPIHKFSSPPTTCNICKPPKTWMVAQGEEYKNLIQLVTLIRNMTGLEEVGLIMRLDITNAPASR
jgi:hypothetical protein